MIRPLASATALAVGLAVFVLASCSSGSSGSVASAACVQNLSLDCKPLFDPPTYQAIFDHTLRATCAAGSGTCHTSDAAKGGLVFEDADRAYALLLGTADGRQRVVPGDPACSVIMERLESTDPSFHMPPGPTSLSGPELCAVAQWIAAGAKR